MSNRRRRESTTRRQVILIFGESLNDSRSIKVLVEYLNPSWARKVQAVPNPTTLNRGAQGRAVSTWLERLQGAITSFETRQEVHAVLVHRDSDRPHDSADGQELADQLNRISAAGVLAVQQIEAWWFLFPAQVERVRPIAWRNLLPAQPGDTQRINNPKAHLKSLTSKSKNQYSESDSVAIAQNIAEDRADPVGTNDSWDRFQLLVRSF